MIHRPILTYMTSQIFDSAEIGHANRLFPRVVMNPFSEACYNCMVNTNVTIDHDVIFGNYIDISPNSTLLGGVAIDNCVVGAGSIIKEALTNSENTVIGLDSVIVNDVQLYILLCGNPVKAKKKTIW